MLKLHLSGRLWFFIAVLICAGFSLAQNLEPAEPPAEPPSDSGGDVVFRTETALMEVEVKAKTRRGDLVEGLTRDDFQLFENDEPQAIVSFEYVDYPRAEAPAQRVERIAQGEIPAAPGAIEPAPKPTESDELRIFIATHIGEAEELRARKAVRKFIEQDMPAHAKVSINGTPFIPDRAELLAYIDKVGLRDVMSGNNFTEIRPRIPLELDMKSASLQGNADALIRGVDPNTPSQAHNMYDDHLSRVRMLRYVDLIRDLSAYPGKKMIVLFSRGYSMGFDSFQRQFAGLQDADLLERLRGESMRARISMYVVDARGLEVGSVGADNATGMTSSTIFSKTQTEYGVPLHVQMQAPVTGGLDDSYRSSQQGLKVLAKMTDGVAVTNSNDLGEIFEHVKKDLGGYYLIGYSPPKREDTRSMREIKITAVNSPEIRLDYRKGYYDNEEFRRALAEEQRRRIEKLLGPSPSKTTNEAPLPSLTLYKTAFDELAGAAPSYPRVIADLEQAVEGYPQFAVAWNVLGYSREQLGDAAGAREAYEKAADADPEYLQPQAHLARMEIQDQDWEAAKKRAEALLQADQERADARFFLATAEFNLDHLDAAGKAVE
ncbi:MAG TPA: VWA domain-containing protein, partial [Bryobacterales bacterium]|nr:VWA domain-containing protein [Bryobacterales bacterium]